MKIYVGVTDHDWFDNLGCIPNIEEVNFWQPSSHASFRAIGKGDLFLFKLHRSPRTRNQDVIAGGGIFNSFSILPISTAWEFFEHKNGAPSYFEMRRRLLKYKKLSGDSHEDFRSCAITEEHSLAALEAAHIKPYAENGLHEVSNGLLLRSDFHRLFDRFYITVTPEYRIEISRRLKEEFDNGRSYYPFRGKRLSHLPEREEDRPDKNMIIWHNERFIG